MRTINEYLLSKKKTKFNDFPKEGEKAYDWNDEEWTIVDFCKVSDKDAFKKFKQDYDDFGTLDDLEASMENIDYVVAAENGEYISVFLWDEDGGLHYK